MVGWRKTSVGAIHCKERPLILIRTCLEISNNIWFITLSWSWKLCCSATYIKWKRFWCHTLRRRKTSSHAMCRKKSDFLSDMSHKWKFLVHTINRMPKIFSCNTLVERKFWVHAMCCKKFFLVQYGRVKKNFAWCDTLKINKDLKNAKTRRMQRGFHKRTLCYMSLKKHLVLCAHHKNLWFLVYSIKTNFGAMQ
jgi:hypothetical protein